MRRDDPAGGPWGFVYLAGLVLLLLYAWLFFAPYVIEAQTEEEVAARLKTAGVDALEIEADGQRVRLEGEYRAGQTREGLIALAETTRCSTLLFGRLTCPTFVEAELVSAEPVSAPTPAPVVRGHEFVVGWSGTKIRMSGEVPDSGARRAIVDAARAWFSQAELADELEVTGDRAPPAYVAAFTRAFEVLNHLEDGTAEWKRQRLSVFGNVRAGTATLAEATFYREEGSPPLGSLVLQSIEEIDQCDSEFEDVLADSKIYFRTGRADIGRRSEGVLRRLADIAAECSGDLIIEGHADITGTRAFNRRLSLQRARAVVWALSDMGVNPARLHPRGFGTARPAADNATSAGRAQNRRIEVRVQRTEL